MNRRATPTGPSRAEMARSYLRYLLNEQGPMQWTDILAASAQHGHTPATLREVRHEVAEKMHRDGHWYWLRLKENHDG